MIIITTSKKNARVSFRSCFFLMFCIVIRVKFFFFIFVKKEKNIFYATKRKSDEEIFSIMRIYNISAWMINFNLNLEWSEMNIFFCFVKRIGIVNLLLCFFFIFSKMFSFEIFIKDSFYYNIVSWGRNLIHNIWIIWKLKLNS